MMNPHMAGKDTHLAVAGGTAQSDRDDRPAIELF